MKCKIRPPHLQPHSSLSPLNLPVIIHLFCEFLNPPASDICLVLASLSVKPQQLSHLKPSPVIFPYPNSRILTVIATAPRSILSQRLIFKLCSLTQVRPSLHPSLPCLAFPSFIHSFIQPKSTLSASRTTPSTIETAHRRRNRTIVSPPPFSLSYSQNSLSLNDSNPTPHPSGG